MNITPETIVSEVVKTNYKTAPVFQGHNIDFCCGGNKPIAEACKGSGLDPESLIRELSAVSEEADPDSDYIDRLKLTQLCDYIMERHHAYVRNSIPFLIKNLDKICQVHGEHHPELLEIRDLFLASARALPMHMQKEEMILFPYIRKLEEDKRGELKLPPSPFGTIMNPISMMMEEHQDEGERFKEIADLCSNYRIPEDGCTTYEVTLKKLQEFENDLHRHIHLENNILFPKAIALEQE